MNLLWSIELQGTSFAQFILPIFLTGSGECSKDPIVVSLRHELESRGMKGPRLAKETRGLEGKV